MDSFSPTKAQQYYDEMQKVTQEYDDYKSYSSNIEELLEQDIREKELQIKMIKNSMESLQQKLVDLRSENADLQLKNSQLKEMIEKIKQGQKEEKQKFTEIEIDFDQNEEKLRQYQSLNQQLQEQNETFNEKIIILENQISSQDTEHQNLLRNALNKIAELEDENAVLKTKQVKQDKQIKENQAQTDLVSCLNQQTQCQIKQQQSNEFIQTEFLILINNKQTQTLIKELFDQQTQCSLQTSSINKSCQTNEQYSEINEKLLLLEDQNKFLQDQINKQQDVSAKDDKSSRRLSMISNSIKSSARLNQGLELYAQKAKGRKTTHEKSKKIINIECNLTDNNKSELQLPNQKLTKINTLGYFRNHNIENVNVKNNKAFPKQKSKDSIQNHNVRKDSEKQNQTVRDTTPIKNSKPSTILNMLNEFNTNISQQISFNITSNNATIQQTKEEQTIQLNRHNSQIQTFTNQFFCSPSTEPKENGSVIQNSDINCDFLDKKRESMQAYFKPKHLILNKFKESTNSIHFTLLVSTQLTTPVQSSNNNQNFIQNQANLFNQIIYSQNQLNSFISIISNCNDFNQIKEKNNDKFIIINGDQHFTKHCTFANIISEIYYLTYSIQKEIKINIVLNKLQSQEIKLQMNFSEYIEADNSINNFIFDYYEILKFNSLIPSQYQSNKAWIKEKFLIHLFNNFKQKFHLEKTGKKSQQCEITITQSLNQISQTYKIYVHNISKTFSDDTLNKNCNKFDLFCSLFPQNFQCTKNLNFLFANSQLYYLYILSTKRAYIISNQKSIQSQLKLIKKFKQYELKVLGEQRTK